MPPPPQKARPPTPTHPPPIHNTPFLQEDSGFLVGSLTSQLRALEAYKLQGAGGSTAATAAAAAADLLASGWNPRDSRSRRGTGL